MPVANRSLHCAFWTGLTDKKSSPCRTGSKRKSGRRIVNARSCWRALTIQSRILPSTRMDLGRPIIACPQMNPSSEPWRSEEHTSELQSLMRISYAVFCLKKNTPHQKHENITPHVQ